VWQQRQVLQGVVHAAEEGRAGMRGRDRMQPRQTGCYRRQETAGKKRHKGTWVVPCAGGR